MIKKAISILMFFVGLLGHLSAQYIPFVNVDYQGVFSTINPLLYTDNPSAIAYNSIDSITVIKGDYRYVNGDYQRALDAAVASQLSLSTESYRRLKKLKLYGAFRYDNLLLQDKHFSNTYAPYHNSPYILIDTIGGDNCSVEQYRLTTVLSYPVSANQDIAAKLEYNVGMGAQSSDPRAVSDVYYLKTQIGTIKALQSIKLGADIFYKYRKENNDVRNAEFGSFYTLLNHGGLGTSGALTAMTFYRLYKQMNYGANLFIATPKNITRIGVYYDDELTLDAHKGSTASWSTVKTDSKYLRQGISLQNIYTHQEALNYHQVKCEASYHIGIGQEYLQEMVSVDDQFYVVQWQTLNVEDKYSKTQVMADVNYSFSTFKNKYLRSQEISLGASYISQLEMTNFGDQELGWSCAALYGSYSKLFLWKKNTLDAEVSLRYHHNINKTFDLALDNFITEEIIIPDWHYDSSNNITTTLGLTYSFRIDNKMNYFINLNYELNHCTSGYFANENRGVGQLSLGALF